MANAKFYGTGRRKKSDPSVYKRKHPARVGEWGSGASDADFQQLAF